MTTALLLAALAAVVALTWLGAHRRFVRQRQHVAESARDVDVELRRRHDLVPALVRVVEAHAAHERTLLALLAAEQGALAGPVDRVGETNPELAADAAFVELRRRLHDTEERLAAARRVHADNVRAYDDRVRTFPTSLVARAGGFGAVG